MSGVASKLLVVRHSFEADSRPLSLSRATGGDHQHISMGKARYGNGKWAIATKHRIDYHVNKIAKSIGGAMEAAGCRHIRLMQ